MSESGSVICGTLPCVKLPAPEPGHHGGQPDDDGVDAAAADVSDPAPEPPEQRIDQRVLDEIFGDLLPDTTSDERGPVSTHDDDWYLENRPPHHDR